MTTAIVTGSTSGVGKATAAALAARGMHVVHAVRDTTKAEGADVRELDLADLASVRAFAQAWTGPVDLLVNNAGVSARTLRRTADGFELDFGTNHLGHFALTNLLLPHLTGRVVTLASQAERAARLDLADLNWERTPYKPARAYNNSKLANLLFTSALQRRLTAAGSQVRAMAAHPGFVASNIYAGTSGPVAALVRLLAQDAEHGALPVLYAATADLPGDSFTGPEHLMHMRGGAQLIKRSRAARDPGLADRLWDASERLTEVGWQL